MVKILSISIFGTLLVSALITPLIYCGIMTLWPEMPWPFSRVYDRVAMFTLLGALIYYRKQFELTHLKNILKHDVLSSRINQLVCAGLLSIVLSALALPFLLSPDRLIWNQSNLSEVYFWKIVRFIPAALLISLIEESFFRFILLNFLKQRLHWFLAAIASSVLYALVHFIAPDKRFLLECGRFFAGIEYLGLVTQRIFDPALLSAIFGLFLVGMTLSLIMHFYSRIYICIGLHFGWVMMVKALGYLTMPAPGFVFPPDAGRRYYLVSTLPGWLSIILVATLVLIFLKYLHSNRTGKEA